MSKRHYLSIASALLIIIVLYLSRHELVQAWHLLQRVDLRILALIIPLQALSYYALGAIVFSYLKQKEKIKASSLEMGKIALELNFVNHILPSGGVSGASYMTWRLNHLGIGMARSTLAQVVRIAATFGAYLLLLMVALLLITLDGNINRLTILVTSMIASSIIFSMLFILYVINSKARLYSFSQSITARTNHFMRAVFKRKKPLLSSEKVALFFSELHADYVELKREPRILIKPFLWGLVFNIAEVSMFAVAFWALGTPINPAPILIAYGIASIAGFFVVTPGGAGAYEVLMITFLSSAGIGQGVAVAGVLLARTLLIITTIISGYVFYQLALNRYGKRPVKR